MKRLLAFFLCMLLLPMAVLCGCSTDSDSDIPVITKASVSYSLQTTTTTTVATTLPSGGATQPTKPHLTGTTTLPTVATDGETTEVGNAIAQTAISLIGTPYKSGASGPDAFDNPGFVSYCYKQAGHSLPRKAASMVTFGEEAPLDALRPGDLLLFCNELGGEIQFAGIYIGDNKFVACNNPSSPTKDQKLDKNYWLPRLMAARRPAE